MLTLIPCSKKLRVLAKEGRMSTCPAPLQIASEVIYNKSKMQKNKILWVSGTYLRMHQKQSESKNFWSGMCNLRMHQNEQCMKSLNYKKFQAPYHSQVLQNTTCWNNLKSKWNIPFIGTSPYLRSNLWESKM